MERAAVNPERTGRSLLTQWRPWIVLIFLTAAFAVSFIDRYLLAMVIQPVKADLKLSDTEIGLLTGFAFSAFYAIFALPLARIADQGYSRLVVGVSLLCWSAATALCGFVASFMQLAGARFAVGAGEAGCVPASQTIIGNLFAEDRRNTALAIFSAAGSLGLTLAFAFGGFFEPRLGWRLTFVCAALPGAILGLLVPWVLPGASHTGAGSKPVKTRPFRESVRSLSRNELYVHMPFVFAACIILQLGQLQWLPAYMGRSFGVPRAELGAKLALMLGPAMLIGTVVGGQLADRLGRRHWGWPIGVIGLSAICALLPEVILYTTHSPNVALSMAMASGFFVGMPGGPAYAFVQRVVDFDQRATAVAIAMMGSAFLGLGAGPLLIGFLSDRLTPLFGVEALRWSLLTVCLLATAWLMFHVTKILRCRVQPNLACLVC